MQYNPNQNPIQSNLIQSYPKSNPNKSNPIQTNPKSNPVKSNPIQSNQSMICTGLKMLQAITVDNADVKEVISKYYILKYTKSEAP